MLNQLDNSETKIIFWGNSPMANGPYPGLADDVLQLINSDRKAVTEIFIPVPPVPNPCFEKIFKRRFKIKSVEIKFIRDRFSKMNSKILQEDHGPTSMPLGKFFEKFRIR